MRATRIVSGFVGWRWAPCCALIAGSLLFVALIVLVVPDSLGKLPGSVSPPVVPQSDMLTSDALGHDPSLPPQHLSTPTPHTPMAPIPHTRATPTTPTTPATPNVGRPAQTPPELLPRSVQARAAAIAAALPARTARPTPGAEPRAAEPAAPDNAPTREEPAPPAKPRPKLHAFMGRLHILAPHVPAPAIRERPAGNSAEAPR